MKPLNTHKIRNYLALTVLFSALAWGTAFAQAPAPNCCQLDTGWAQPILGDAAGVAVDRTRHRVYAVDRGSGALNAYDYTGAAVSVFGTNGTVSNAGAFFVAMGNRGYDGVYIVQRSPSGEAVKYDPNGNVVWNSVTLGGGANRYIYVDDSGLVYVADDTGKIYILDNTGTLQNTLTGYALSTPTGLYKVGSTLYVVDTMNSRIVSLPKPGLIPMEASIPLSPLSPPLTG